MHHVFSLPAVVLVAGLLGAILPLTAHLGIDPDDDAGMRLSWLYLANIIGSAAGSLLTGFWLLDVLSLTGISLWLGLLGLFLAGVLVTASGGLRGANPAPWLLGAATAVAMVFAVGPLYGSTFEKLQLEEDHRPGVRFARTIENRSGVITVTADGTVFGGGVYDGVFSTDLLEDRNAIVRAYTRLARSIRGRVTF